MLLMPSNFRSPLLKQLLISWWKSGNQVRSRKTDGNPFELRCADVQCLEDRVLLAHPTVAVSSNAVAANANAIMITGTNFDPTPANDTVAITDVTNPGTTITAHAQAVVGTTSMFVAFDSVVGPLTANDKLDAVVTNGLGSSGAPVKVGVVVPVVTANNGLLAASATSINISGFGFDPAKANRVDLFDNGVQVANNILATGVTDTSLTVSLTGVQLTGGDLSATVTVNTQTSGTAPGTDVATIEPVVTVNTSPVAVNATSLTISGFGFDTNTANDSVLITDTVTNSQITVTPTLVNGTGTSMTVSLAGLAGPLTGGDPLTAAVTTDLVTGATRQVGTFAPVVTQDLAATVAANSPTLTFSGSGFDPVLANNTVIVLDVTTNTFIFVTPSSGFAASLTVSLAGLGRLTGGDILQVAVTTNSETSSPMVQVAQIAPSVTLNLTHIPANATTLTIAGSGFDSILSNNTVLVTDTVTNVSISVNPTVVNATGTSMTVSLAGIGTLTGGDLLTAAVKTNNVISTTTPPVAAIAPVVAASASSISANATTLTISGVGFDTLAINNSVLITDTVTGHSVTVNPSPIGLTGTSMTVSLTGLAGPFTGGDPLTAVVTSVGASSGAAQQVATFAPVVTPSGNSIPAIATTLTINGLAFDPIALNNSVTITDSVTGHSTTVHPTFVNGTGTSMTVSVTGLAGPVTGGDSLYAVVTTDGVSSGAAQLVATIGPGVTPSTNPVPANATSLTINGFGFDTTLVNNSVLITDTVTGHTTTVNPMSVNGTGTSMTVSLTGLAGPLTGGDPLTAVVTTTNMQSSAPPVQVGTIQSVVTQNLSNPIPATSTSLTFAGIGFDPVLANNTVVVKDVRTNTTIVVNPPSSGNATSLTVSLAGIGTLIGGDVLEVAVSTNGVSSSGFVQVATVVPSVTSNLADLPANATSLTITGSGFDPTFSNNSVLITDTVTGHTTTVTPTFVNLAGISMNVSLAGLAGPLTGGDPLTAVVTTDSASSGAAVQVATIQPVVTTNIANLPANATSLTITGFGFDTTAGNNSVLITDTVTGHTTTVNPTTVNGTGTSMTVSLAGLAGPITGGDTLTAVVTTDTVSSGAPQQVATIQPVVTTSNNPISPAATTLTINGFGFDPTAGNNSVLITDTVTGHTTTVTPTTVNGTGTSMTVSLTGLAGPITGGDTLTAVVTTNGVSSATTEVATIQPVVNMNAANLPANATTLTITGLGFDTTAGNNSVLITDTVTGHSITVNPTLVNLTGTSMTVPLTGLAGPLTGGDQLTAVVTTDGASSGAAVQVVTIQPVVTLNTSPISPAATTLTINGFGFDTTLNNNSVLITDTVTGHTTTVNPTTVNGTGTSMTVSLAGLAGPITSGDTLTAVVTTNGVSNGAAVEVATIAPFVNTNTNPIPANATSLTITGAGFDPTAANNSVLITDTVTGHTTTVTPTTVNGTGTSMTVSLTGLAGPITGGDTLTAVVTTNGVSSPTTEVATIQPVVTLNTANLPANATSLTINGFGFDTIAANNSVLITDTVTGHTTTVNPTTVNGTGTSLTVSLTGLAGPITGGDTLTAVVTTDGVSSLLPAVQVATIQPVATVNASNIPANATTLTITGFGFDTTAANNSVLITDTVTGHTTTVNPTTVNGTGTSMTVSLAGLAGPITGGDTLTAVVTTNGVSSSSAQVATIAPVVTLNAGNIPANATSLTINGFGFDTTAANNSVLITDTVTGHATTVNPTTVNGTGTSMTVSLTGLAGPITGGDTLTAVVTTDGVSSATTQVATIAPVVTVSTAPLPVNVSTLTINGFGFDTTLNNNSVLITDTVTGHTTTVNPTTVNGTGTSMTVSLAGLAGPLTGGDPLTAVVTTDGVSSSSTQVATFQPVVTMSVLNLAQNGTTLVIHGLGFDPVAAHNSVQFNLGAVDAISVATSTSLTITFSTKPTATGSLTAIVTTDGQDSGAAVQVATVIAAIPAPTVTSNTANLPANASSIVINGTGFDASVNGNNLVTFNDGAVGHVTSATANSLTVAFDTTPVTAGVLTAVVSVDGVSMVGAPVQVATVIPVVTPNSSALPANPTTITINGFGFDPTANHNTVTFNDGAVGTVQTSTPTSLTVTFSTPPQAAGNLTAVVTTDGISSGAPVQVASVGPIVTPSTAILTANAGMLFINGAFFDQIIAHDSVTFDDGAVGTVTFATPTQLTVTFTTRPVTAGPLHATVTVNGISTGPVQVATVAPVVVNSVIPPTLPANATSVVISGFGFDSTLLHNTVVFNDGAAGFVSAASPTSLTVTFTTPPVGVGNLTAVVTTNGVTSGTPIGTPVTVATVIPVVTATPGNTIPVNASTVTITGAGFDPVAANNLVFFNDGAAGNVISATSTSLTVNLFTKPVTAGSLTALVLTDNVSNGSAVQVATVTTVVTLNTANLSANAPTVTIHGLGFDTTPANNTVTFNDGAAGNVTASTATSLTVTFTAQPTGLGSLTAIVTTNGASSGAAVQVATITVGVTMSAAGLPANSADMTIAGVGFDGVTPSNNTVVFNDGAVGHVTVSTTTTLTVVFDTKPTTAGPLTAVVTSDSVSSGTPVQVATVTPVVTMSIANLPINSSTLVINGFGFDPIAAHNSVQFNDGAIDAITSATPTSLTVTFSTKPVALGTLTAIVTTNGQNSGGATQVATVTAAVVTPSVTLNTANLPANATTLTITGTNFDLTAGNNSVLITDTVTGHTTTVNPTTVNGAGTSMTVSLTGLAGPITGGDTLTAVVTTPGGNSGAAVQVATIAPVVTSSAASLPINSNSITINGFGFSLTPASNTVVFNDGAVGTVFASTATSLTVNFSTKPTATGTLTAVVTTNGVSSGSPVQVATVTVAAPTVTLNTANLNANAGSLIINGTGFSQLIGQDSVTFNNGAVGTVTFATSTSLSVTFSTRPIAGNLTAIVTVNGVPSGAAVQVATVVPIVTSSNTSVANGATSMTINGFGFDPTAANNSVTFNNGAVGTVFSSTTTSLTIHFTTPPTTAGSLTAVVTTNGQSSGSPVQVGTVGAAVVGPVVTMSTAILNANAGTMTINGANFSQVIANDTVVFNDGAVGTVTFAGTNFLTVTFSTKPQTAGPLTAVVTVNGVSSGPAVQVATVAPVLTPSVTVPTIPHTATSITISGVGFDPVAANNTVIFNLGALGHVTAATTTSLTIVFDTPPTAGSLTLIVMTDGVVSNNGVGVKVANVT